MQPISARRRPIVYRALLALVVATVAGAPPAAQQAKPLPPIELAKVSLPPGFQIALYAQGVASARQMALAPDGTVFVGSFGLFSGNPKIGNVYAVRDTNKDGRADEVKTILSGLNMPNGVAFRDGALFVGEQHRIVRFDDVLARLEKLPAPAVVADLPTDPGTINHSWKFLEFGPDGKLYVPVGGPCNVCDRGDPWATILRMNADGSGREIFARGVRNSVGLTFEPNGGTLWFTDNGRDMLGDNLPSDEVNRAPAAGQHFGFPYCHQGDVLDPEFGKGKSCADYRPPMAKMGPHVAALGLTFYTGDMFPAQYKNQIFVAEHGSWNRSTPLGYRIAVVRVQDGASSGQEVFAGGFYDGTTVMGRPVDVLQLADGSLLVSDDVQGVIYRITYRG
jgi:glucose/arabinose dehydrogenase